MSNSKHPKLRVRFEKTGAIRYIGHLDVMRFFQKCIRRAGIDISFTGGFSPHQIMTFASPLSVGLESKGEYMDIEVESYTSSEDMIQRLNDASVPEIKIVSVKLLPEGAGNAMASVAGGEYLVSLREGTLPELFSLSEEDFEKAILSFLEQEEILYRKEGKSGERFVNIRPGIFSLSWNRESQCCHMLLDCSSSGNVKPIQVVESFLKFQGIPEKDFSLKILRLDLYTRDGEGQLISMDAVGEVI